MSNAKPIKSANDSLDGFNGTEQYYKSQFSGKINYTDGIKHLAEIYECRWLLDIVFSVQNKPKVLNESFKIWELKRKKESNAFRLTCKDDDGNVLYEQEIPFSDFKDDYVKMWEIDNILMLPSEY